jgi:hypothetical protein
LLEQYTIWIFLVWNAVVILLLFSVGILKMGRPDDVRRRKELKELEQLRSKDSSEINVLKDVVDKQNELINKILSKDTKTSPANGLTKEELLEALSGINISVDGQVEDPNKPKIGDHYVNPSEGLKIKESNLDSAKLEGKKVSFDNSDVDKLKKLLHRKEDDK